MLRTWVWRAGMLAALTAGLLTIAGPSYATTAPRHQVGAVTVTHRVVTGDTAWGLAARFCGAGQRYTSMTVRSPAGAARNLALIYPGDTATIPCARPGTGGQPAKPAAKPASSASWVHPLPGGRVSGCYGDPRDGGTRRHHGIYISAPRGTLLKAPGAGVVVSARWRGGYGRTVEIRHPNGYTTLLAHGSALLVRAGQRVSAGQGVARVGDSGNPRPGAYHLHLEVRRNGVAVSTPGAWFRARGVRMGCA